MRYSMLLQGPPGTGKSTAAATVADLPDVEKTLLCACKGRERHSYGYQARLDKIDIELYEDPRWRPSLDRLEADAHIRLLRRLDNLLGDDSYDAIIIDPFTDAAINISHEILKGLGVGSAGDLADSFGYYASLKDKADELVRTATMLTEHSKRPKHVVVTMHVQPPKDDVLVGPKGNKTAKPSADRVARGVEYEGSVLPMIDGGYRRKMCGDFDVVIYSGFDEDHYDAAAKERKKNWYNLQVSPDHDKFSKIAVAPVLTQLKIDNNLVALMEAVDATTDKQ